MRYHSRPALPGGGVAGGEAAGDVFEVAAVVRGATEVSDDTEGEGVTAHAGEVFAQQVSGPVDVAARRGTNHFNVVAFPAHLLAIGRGVQRFGHGGEICNRHGKGGVSGHCQPQRHHGVVPVGGALSFAVTGCRLLVGGHHAAMDLDRRFPAGLVDGMGGGTARCRLHECQGACGP